jgi:hypothetical protein
MALTGSASEGLFTTLLYPEGGTEATHAGEFADLLPCGDQPGNTEALLAMLEDVKFPITIDELAGMLAMFDISEEAAEGLFTTLLAMLEGGTEATHAISSGYIAGEFADLLPCGDQPGNAEALLAMLDGVEFPITIDELAGMLAMIDISEEEPYAAMARLGLSLAPDEVEAIPW